MGRQFEFAENEWGSRKESSPFPPPSCRGGKEGRGRSSLGRRGHGGNSFFDPSNHRPPLPSSLLRTRHFCGETYRARACKYTTPETTALALKQLETCTYIGSEGINKPW